MKYLFSILAFSLFLSGCVVSPKRKFPEYYKEKAYDKDLTLVIDTIVLSDVRGKTLGVNREKNAEAKEIVEQSVLKHLENRGYKTNLLYHGNGITLILDDKAHYEYSEDWKATGEVFLGPDEQVENDPWVREGTKKFLQRLIEKANSIGKKVYRKSDIVPSIQQEEIPKFIQELPSDNILFISAHGIEVGTGKSIGTGILTGVLTAALTGGLYVASMPVSTSRVQVIVFNKKTSRVLWYAEAPDSTGYAQASSYPGLDSTFKQLFKDYPMVDGGFYKDPVVRQESGDDFLY